MVRWLRASLGRTLFVSYVLIIAVGVVTLVVTMQLVAPPLLVRHIAEALAMRERAGATAPRRRSTPISNLPCARPRWRRWRCRPRRPCSRRWWRPCSCRAGSCGRCGAS